MQELQYCHGAVACIHSTLSGLHSLYPVRIYRFQDRREIMVSMTVFQCLHKTNRHLNTYDYTSMFGHDKKALPNLQLRDHSQVFQPAER